MNYTIQALLGEIGMDPILESVSSSLYNGQIPNVWMKLAPQTCKNLGGWIEHFVSRTEQYAEWVCYYFSTKFKLKQLMLDINFNYRAQLENLWLCG